MDQIERSISADPIVCRIHGKCQSFCVFIPVFLLYVRDVHLNRPSQRLHHTLRSSVRLRSVRHGRTLLLPCDPIKCPKKVGHKSRLPVVTYSFTGSKSSKHTFFVSFSDRLRGPRRTCSRDHIP